MTTENILQVFNWWFYIFLIGVVFIPLSKTLFSKFFDRGYIFSKTLGIAAISYSLFILSSFKVLELSRLSLFLLLIIFGALNLFLYKRNKIKVPLGDIKIFLLMEVIFLVSLFFWSYIKSFQPDIYGLEKFMDFGFINSILRTKYLPPVDMWLPPNTINYYYFGHFTTAMLIRISSTSPFVAYNIMLATIFAFTSTSAFSIVATLSKNVFKSKPFIIMSGLLAGILTSLGGNLQTIYAFFAPYTTPENPVPFWNLQFLPFSFPNGYWYPNATRFIPYTIHEFPSYSFVVSDLHGHVLDIPFVLLAIALILKIFLDGKVNYKVTILFSLLLAILYMTNAWDGIIYFGLFSLSILAINYRNFVSDKIQIGTLRQIGNFIKSFVNKKYLYGSSISILSVGVGYFIFSLPFNINFSPFVSGMGVICAPNFLTSIGKIGPLLFEPNHCQRTPIWMFPILYGFFYIFTLSMIVKVLKIKKYNPIFLFSIVVAFFASLLIIAPEFIYAKDIYPQHYRANTVFKLGYQAYIMLSLITSFSIVFLIDKSKKIIWIPIITLLLFLNLSYPFLAIKSYFGDLKIDKGLNGLAYLKIIYPEDYSAILWIQENIKNDPVILESQGDSYTDHERISANTGLPTVLGWTVHEWLWRGDYAIPAARLGDVKALYEGSIEETSALIAKYNIKYIYIGALERKTYTNMNESKFKSLGELVYHNGSTDIYLMY